jgi:hypothetical protein
MLGIIFVSINSYFGEMSFLSLTSFYEKENVSLWSIGTGWAGFTATGSYLILNRYIDLFWIFSLNLVFYLWCLVIGIGLLSPIPIQQELIFKEEPFSVKNNLGTILWISSPLILSYFISYFYGFYFIPLLSKSTFDYQLLQWITQVGKLCGRWIGSYIHLSIPLLLSFHIYNLVIGILSQFIHLSIIYISVFYFFIYFLNGVMYPNVYHQLYQRYDSGSKERVMGMVGQFTSFFTILGCLLGTILSYVS